MLFFMFSVTGQQQYLYLLAFNDEILLTVKLASVSKIVPACKMRIWSIFTASLTLQRKLNNLFQPSRLFDLFQIELGYNYCENLLL